MTVDERDPGLMLTWIVIAIAAALSIYGVYLFNRLVRTRQLAEEGWSGIDVQLRRRADLVPNLVNTVEGYAKHERALFADITALRSQLLHLNAGEVAERGRLESNLSGALARLMAVAEAYPDLKASHNFRDLQTSLVAVEDEIQMSRRYYNGATRNLNVMVESFPSNVVARLFGFAARDYFEIDAADRAVPEVVIGG
jgi:LemA protein